MSSGDQPPAPAFWNRARKLDPAWIAVGLLVLIAASPLFRPGLPDIADAPIHLFRTAEWVRSWQAGILVPRWSPTLAYVYGYPLFVFAPPLPYAFAGALHLLGLSLETSIKLLSIGCLVLAGGGMFLLVRGYLGSAAGVVAAAAYLFAPFLLREAYLYGGNYPQLLAISLYPGVLWAFHRLAKTGRAPYLLLATGLYGALMLSHNFHALVFTPVLALLVLGDAILLRPRRFWPRLGQGFLAGVAPLVGTGLRSAALEVRRARRPGGPHPVGQVLRRRPPMGVGNVRCARRGGAHRGLTPPPPWTACVPPGTRSMSMEASFETYWRFSPGYVASTPTM